MKDVCNKVPLEDKLEEERLNSQGNKAFMECNGGTIVQERIEKEEFGEWMVVGRR